MINHEYLELFNEGSVRKDIDIVYDADQHISNSDVVSGTFSLNESAFTTKELRFGSLVASELSVKLYNTVPNLMDKEISVSIALDNMASNPLKIGKYKVLEDKPTTDRLYKQIKAYDSLYEVINKEVVSWYEGLLFPMTLKVFRDSFFNYLGIEQENTTLINDDMLVDKTILSNSIPGKQVLSAICELNGAIGRMNRDSKFEYVVLDANPSSRITIDNIASKSGSYEDFDCQPISKVQIRQTTDDIGAIVGEDGNTYIMQDNFLVYGKSASDLNAIATNLLSVIKDIAYTPFNIKAIYGNPCYEIGDAITVVTANKTFNSYMFNRTLKGIQAMTDNIKADGIECYTENLNSANTQIQQLARQTNELSRTVEETKSIVSSLELNNEFTNVALGKEITIEDSGSYPLIELYGYGRSEQKSYKGINLVDLSVPSGLNSVSNYSFDNETGLVSFDYDGNYPMPRFLANHLIGKKVYLYYKNVVNSNADASNAVNFVYKASDGSTKYIGISASGTTIPSDATSCTFQIISNNSTTVLSGTFSANIMVSSEATETYEKYVSGEPSPNPSYPQDIVSVADDGDLVVKSNNKNLFNPDDIYMEKTIINSDGSFAEIEYYNTYRYDVRDKDNIAFSYIKGTSYDIFRFALEVDGIITRYTTDKTTYIVDTSLADYFYVTIANTAILDLQIEYGKEVTDYQPHQSTQATIPLTDSLRGIKVTDGGNYTDKTGQQWVCDTLEKYADGSGKLVQRVVACTVDDYKVVRVSSDANWYDSEKSYSYELQTPKISLSNNMTILGMCTHFSSYTFASFYSKNIETGCMNNQMYIVVNIGKSLGICENVNVFKQYCIDNNVQFIKVLATPIETPLTAEQMAEIEKLQTFNHITHVTTDDIGDIAIQYYKNNANAEVVATQGNRISKAESSITQNAESIKSKVSKGDVSSEISQEADLISIKGNRFELLADNIEITKDGKLTTNYIIANEGFAVKQTLVGSAEPINVFSVEGNKSSENSNGYSTIKTSLGYINIANPVRLAIQTEHGDIDTYNTPFITEDYTDNAGWHIRKYSNGVVECEGMFLFTNISPTGTFGDFKTSYMDLTLPSGLFNTAPNKIYNISPLASFGMAVGNIIQNDSALKVRLYCMHTYSSATTYIATVRCWSASSGGVG